MNISISNNKENNGLMVDYLISIGHEARISEDHKNYIDGELAGNRMKPLWDDFHTQNSLLAANNVCIVKAVKEHGYSSTSGYGIDIRYNFTSVYDDVDSFFSEYLQDVVKYAKKISRDRKFLLCCSFSVSGEKAILESNIHPWGV